MEPNLLGGCIFFLKFMKLTFASLKKIRTKILGVDNAGLYLHAKSQSKFVIF
jgi:hypothetical protein